MSRLSIEIPDSLHQQLKANASLRGLSLRDFVLQRLGMPVQGGRASQKRAQETHHEEVNCERRNADTRAAPGSMLELLENRPWKGTMTKAEIDACIAEERANWHDDV